MMSTGAKGGFRNMRIDLYTKVVLTVIAVALAV